MSRLARTEFSLADYSDLKISVVVHPTEKTLYRAWTKFDGTAPDFTAAFCHFPKPSEKRKPEVLAELHFCHKYLTVSTIAHEALHAAFGFARHARLVMHEDYGEELLALAVQNITAQTIAFCERKKLPLEIE
ncbi:MAG TPA: hypothetical protein VEH04_17165 [Verrucomicrobiae bacterium]|nr:hypothetical protein [Verrucomicrobiae bacterium]